MSQVRPVVSVTEAVVTIVMTLAQVGSAPVTLGTICYLTGEHVVVSFIVHIIILVYILL